MFNGKNNKNHVFEKVVLKTAVFKYHVKNKKFNDYFPNKNDLHNKREIPEVMQTYS